VISDHNALSHLPSAQGVAGRALMRGSIAATYRLADARVAVSKGVANIVAQLGLLRRESIHVIYNPAARGTARKAEASGADPWGGRQGKRIVSVGSLKAQKDHATLIRAFANVAQSLDATLVILGEGPTRAELQSLIARLHLEQRVELHGFVLDPYPWYERADLFVLSSRYEGFANVIVEAMECGLPIVSTACESGPSEILEDGRFGRLVPVADERALAEAMIASLAEPKQMELQMKRAAEFSLDRASAAYLDLFNQVMAKA
jgi:glycosyltransferase involved in cell wall biosynthesis